MANKIVVFGATGYTGRQVVESLVKQGVKPVIAGRSMGKLENLSRRMGGLSTVRADAENPSTVAALAGRGDVLVSTVGPFAKWGQPALEAAVSRGAHYIDSTGEPAFVARVFQEYGQRAAQAGVVMIPACGYDYVPGHCAGALALERAGQEAARVDIGYFVTGKGGFEMSQGTKASLMGAMADSSPEWRAGRFVDRFGGTGLRTFECQGEQRPAISLSSSEHFSLPRLFPQVRDVNVYLGWFGRKSYILHGMARVQALFSAIPGVQAGAKKVLSLGGSSQGVGPDQARRGRTGSLIIAQAFDAKGALLGEARLAGVNAYTYTADIMAWAARAVSQGKALGAGVLGPVEAFGLDALIRGCKECGLEVMG